MKTFDYARNPLPEPELFPSGTYNDKSLGQWNAWVVAVPENQQATRLAQVPEQLREHVRRHVDTVNAVRRFYTQKRKRP